MKTFLQPATSLEEPVEEPRIGQVWESCHRDPIAFTVIAVDPLKWRRDDGRVFKMSADGLKRVGR